MKLPQSILVRLISLAVGTTMSREPDFVILRDDGEYLRRWFLTGWSRYDRRSKPANLLEALKRKLPNVYVHEFRDSDDDRALHDHPWWNLSILLLGQYDEHTIAAGGVHHITRRTAGDIKMRAPKAAHRLALIEKDGQRQPCVTLFITGPSVREWGFHCPAGWRPWKVFVDARDSGKIGRGCG